MASATLPVGMFTSRTLISSICAFTEALADFKHCFIPISGVAVSNLSNTSSEAKFLLGLEIGRDEVGVAVAVFWNCRVGDGLVFVSLGSWVWKDFLFGEAVGGLVGLLTEFTFKTIPSVSEGVEKKELLPNRASLEENVDEVSPKFLVIRNRINTMETDSIILKRREQSISVNIFLISVPESILHWYGEFCQLEFGRRIH